MNEVKICPICGKEFRKVHTNQKYCSIECQNKRNSAQGRKAYFQNYAKNEMKKKQLESLLDSIERKLRYLKMWKVICENRFGKL